MANKKKKRSAKTTKKVTMRNISVRMIEEDIQFLKDTSEKVTGDINFRLGIRHLIKFYKDNNSSKKIGL